MSADGRALLRVGARDVLRKWLLRGLYGLARRLRRSRDAGMPRMFIDPEDVIGHGVLTEGAYEHDLLAALDALLDRSGVGRSVALDVGANIGNHSRWFSRRFQRVIAYEPHPVVAEVLRANAARCGTGRVEVRPIALGASRATCRLVDDARDNSGSSHLAGADGDAGGGYRVEVDCGDADLAGRLRPDESVDLVKIDVEGFELDAMRGLEDTLRRHHPAVAFESFGRQRLQEAIAFLRGVGYDQFLTLESRLPRHRGLRALAMLLQGYSVESAALSGDEDRFLSMVVALPATGTPSSSRSGTPDEC
jgi:FkbM family methyltransferase